jgi:hypothetical protein
VEYSFRKNNTPRFLPSQFWVRIFSRRLANFPLELLHAGLFTGEPNRRCLTGGWMLQGQQVCSFVPTFFPYYFAFSSLINSICGGLLDKQHI